MKHDVVFFLVFFYPLLLSESVYGPAGRIKHDNHSIGSVV